MPRITKFPAFAFMGDNATPITKEPVALTKQTVGSADENVTWQLALSPHDLERIIVEANRLGRDGKVVAGYGYNWDTHAIMIKAQE